MWIVLRSFLRLDIELTNTDACLHISLPYAARGYCSRYLKTSLTLAQEKLVLFFQLTSCFNLFYIKKPFILQSISTEMKLNMKFLWIKNHCLGHLLNIFKEVWQNIASALVFLYSFISFKGQLWWCLLKKRTREFASPLNLLRTLH